MTEEKAKLLRSLSIDRTAPEAPRPGRRRWPVLIAIAGLALAVVIALALFVPQLGLVGRAEQIAAQPQPVSPPPQAPAVSIEPRRAGSFAASGFVVARRKATIAAEITGKVVEVLIEEGMTVQAGQIVARLDSVLAEKDRKAYRRHRRAHHINKKFGLSTEQYETMLAAQGGHCVLCPQSDLPEKRLAVDHDHKTGQFRGLSCGRCNVSLGWYENLKYEIEMYLLPDGERWKRIGIKYIPRYTEMPNPGRS